MPIGTKLGRMSTHESRDTLITWSSRTREKLNPLYQH